MREIWKEINGYEGLYLISNFGRVLTLGRSVIGKDGKVRSYKRKYLSTPCNSSGYKTVCLFKNGERKHKHVHRLVAEHFVEGYDEGLVVNHLDGDKLNNNATNLEWCTQKENNIHAYNTGLKSIGSDHHRSKLDELDVITIKYFMRDVNGSTLAKMFGVTKENINYIKANKIWKHI